jgi:hypothetical protein
MKHVGIAFEVLVLGFFLMIPHGMIFDRMNWPLFNSWALIHGSAMIAWPVLTFLSFRIVEAVISFRRRDSN